MSYSQLSDSSSVSSGLDGLQRVLLKLEGGDELDSVCIQGEPSGPGRERALEGSGRASQGRGSGRSGSGSPGSRSLSLALDSDMVGHAHQHQQQALPSPCRLSVERPVYQQTALSETFCSATPNPTDNQRLYDVKLDVPCLSCSPKKTLTNLVPAVSWLGNYHWKHDLVKDVVSGCTVAVMNIPQGMAYALLGNVPPVVGIYMAIFPVLVYAFLGTSRHVAMGSFAVICLMTGKVVSQYSGVPVTDLVANSTDPSVAITDLPVYKPIEVATAVTFMVAVYQLTMYAFRMGIMCSLLSDTLVNGFTAGASIHVFTSQIKDLFGITIPKYNGNFQIIYTYIGVYNNLDTINVAATLISCFTVSLLILDNKYIKPWVSQRSALPVPIELIAVIIGTTASTMFDLHTRYKLTTVGHISIGLPDFESPNFQLIPQVALDSFIIAVIAYIVTMSMALIFAQKLNYEINANQELLAQGAGNLLGSFLSCMPFSASLSRSLIQQTVGGRTQLASIICAIILSIVLVSFGPVFEPLPRCILASLIIVALKGVLLQVMDIVKIWQLSALDGIVWVLTYITVVLVEIDIGLLVGLITSILTILFRGLKPNIYRISRLPNTDIYVESTRYEKVEELKNICIIHYAGGLNFVNRSCFKQEVFKIMDKRPKENSIKIKHVQSLKSNKVLPMEAENEVSFLVLDLSGTQYIDPSGAGALQSLANELAESNVSLHLAATSGSVYDVLQRCGVLNIPNILCFPTVHDAVVYAETKLPKVVHSIRL